MKTKISNYALKTFVLVLMLPMVLTTIGCSTDDSGNPDVLCNQLASASTDYSNALSAFQTDPNEQTCNNLKNVALDFIDAIDNCALVPSQYSDLQDAAQGWTDLDCSQDFD